MKLLSPDDVPGPLRELMEMCFPGGEWRTWFAERNDVFEDTPQQLLSITYDERDLRKNVEDIINRLYDALSFLSIEQVVNPGDIADEILAKLEGRF